MVSESKEVGGFCVWKLLNRARILLQWSFLSKQSLLLQEEEEN
jgi:hypothetical protein